VGAVEDYLEAHPNGCEVSFNAGWIACERAGKEKNGLLLVNALGKKIRAGDPELTRKYELVCDLVMKGYSKSRGVSHDPDAL
jgi:hypothetical protein